MIFGLEDIYAGIEFENGSDDNKKLKDLLKENFSRFHLLKV